MGIERISEFWPSWKPLELLGKGGNGEVYKCIHEEMGVKSYSAIKVINISARQMNTFTFDSGSIRSFCRNLINDCVNEINVMLSLKSCPNIVAIEDFKVVEIVKDEEWEIFIRMEMLTCLTDYLRDRVLTQDEVIKLGVDLCSALELCHSKNIMHRDIKPANIFLNEAGMFKLGDFGIARTLEMATAGFSQKGTVTYVAPEVMYSNDYTKAVDIYSLGLVLYQLANNNRLPFLPAYGDYTHTMQNDAIKNRLKGDTFPPACNADEALNSIFRIACEFEPENRFRSAGQMQASLNKLRSYDGSKTESVRDDNAIDKKKNINIAFNEEKTEQVIRTYEKSQNSAKSKSTLIVISVIAAFCVIVAVISVILIVLSHNDTDVYIDDTSEVYDSSDSEYEHQHDDSSSFDYPYLVSYETPDDAGVVVRSASTYYSEKVAVLEEGTPVRIISGFSSGTEYIQIAFEFDGAETYGWVLGKYIVDDRFRPYSETIEYKIGDIVKFGLYEQDGNYGNGKEPVEWVVLDIIDGFYLMISKYAIDSMPYNNTAEAVKWETCTLRKWLNDEFLNTAFSSAEREQMRSLRIVDSDYSVDDKVFLLNKLQVKGSFLTTEDAKTTATAYARSNGAYTDKNGYCGWWLIDNGDSSDVAARVNIYGEILTSDSAEGGVERTDYAVRPVILVDCSERNIEDLKYNIPVSFEQEKTNIYVSNITESGIGEFVGTPSVDEMLKFAMNHSVLNFNPAVSAIENGTYNLDGKFYEVRIDADYVDRLSVRFFGTDVNAASLNRNDISEGCLYGFSTEVYSQGIAFVKGVYSNSDGDKYKIYFTVYLSGDSDESGYYSYTPAQAEFVNTFEHFYDGYVVLQKYSSSGEDAYKIIEFKKTTL